MAHISKAKLLLGALCLLALLLFNLSQRKEDSAKALEFRAWLKVVDSRPEREGDVIPVSVKIEGDINKQLVGGDAKSRERVMRLLDLLDESKVFNRPFRDSDSYRISIIQRDENFSVSFGVKELKKNIALKNFLALISQFSNE